MYVIHGSRLNGRDEWTFLAESFQQGNGILVASGNFERKRLSIRLHVPLTSVIFIEELPRRDRVAGKRGRPAPAAAAAAAPEPAPAVPPRRRGRPPRAPAGSAPPSRPRGRRPSTRTESPGDQPVG